MTLAQESQTIQMPSARPRATGLRETARGAPGGERCRSEGPGAGRTPAALAAQRSSRPALEHGQASGACPLAP